MRNDSWSRVLIAAFFLNGFVYPNLKAQNSEPDFPMVEFSSSEDPLAEFRIDAATGDLHDAAFQDEWWWHSDGEDAYRKRLQLAAEAASSVERERTLGLFVAVIENDPSALRELVAAGIHPNSPLPKDPPREFLALLPDQRTFYYATKEENFTPLMLAAALGHKEAAATLLEAGADRWSKTKRHKTYPLWLAAKTGDTDLMRMLMNLDPENQWARFRIHVDLATQKLTVWESGEVVFESPVSSGKKAKPTPPGSYIVTDKHREWRSTLYDVKMPHFLRLSCSEIGFHAGRLPGYPASSGCIRLPAEKARELFELIPVGTLAVIE